MFANQADKKIIFSKDILLFALKLPIICVFDKQQALLFAPVIRTAICALLQRQTFVS